MGYDRSNEYTKAHYKCVMVKVPKAYYAEVLKPAADAAGESVGGFLKRSASERILRDWMKRMGAQEGF